MNQTGKKSIVISLQKSEEGEVTVERLTRAMRRLRSTPTTNRAFRTAQELILGSMRTARQLRHLPQIGEERPCAVCGLYEDSADYLSGIQHVFQFCGLARFCTGLCLDLIMMVFGVQIQVQGKEGPRIVYY